LPAVGILSDSVLDVFALRKSTLTNFVDSLRPGLGHEYVSARYVLTRYDISGSQLLRKHTNVFVY